MNPFLIDPAKALVIGMVIGLLNLNPWQKLTKSWSKWLLQISVVGLGFGTNLSTIYGFGLKGIGITFFSVFFTIFLAYLLMKIFKKEKSDVLTLIGVGSAICGGSAIAAISPIIKARDQEMAMALSVVFLLNALAFFIFPPIAHALHMSQEHFGIWAAMSIHDTSNVVATGAVYGERALEIATLLKLIRVLWIIPLMFFFIAIKTLKSEKDQASYSWPKFIIFYLLTMGVRNFWPSGMEYYQLAVTISRNLLGVCLFLIGTQFTIKGFKEAGFFPFFFGLTLWLVVSIVSYSLAALMI